MSNILVDRVSELDDALLTEILSLLPICDVVRTTILSTRWKNVWTTVPCLNFHHLERASKFHDLNPEIVRKFLDGVKKSWRGNRIVKLAIDISTLGDRIHNQNLKYKRIEFTDVNQWVRIAVGKKVEELHVEYDPRGTSAVSLPRCLYSCSWLKVLSLGGRHIEININDNVQWNQLKRLTIRSVNKGCEKGVEQVLRGSPQLQVLILVMEKRLEELSIRSNSLKALSLTNRCSSDEAVEIWTPNLETLQISGMPCGECFVMDAPPSTHATIRFTPATVRLTKRSLKHILPTIRHLERLTLSATCIRGIGTMKNYQLEKVNVNVKLLELESTKENYQLSNVDELLEEESEIFQDQAQLQDRDIVCTLEIFPKLQMLVLQVETLCQAKSCEPRLPSSSFLLELRTVEIAWTNGVNNSVFPLIKMMLKYATNLQKMVFRDNTPHKPNPLSSVSQELLRMPRSSPTAEFIFT